MTHLKLCRNIDNKNKFIIESLVRATKLHLRRTHNVGLFSSRPFDDNIGRTSCEISLPFQVCLQRVSYTIHHPKTYDEYFPFKLPSDIPKLLDVNFCNGLICLLGHSNIVVRWNPLIWKFLTHPKPKVILDRIGVSELLRYTHGLGFDRRNNDYKVVRLVYRMREGDSLVIVPGEAEVFILSKKYWRRVKGPMIWAPEFTYLMRENGRTSEGRETKLLPANVNGVVHSISFGVLLLFYVRDEVLRKVARPSFESIGNHEF